MDGPDDGVPHETPSGASGGRRPRRARFRAGLNRDVVGVLVLVVLAVVCAGLIVAVVVKTHNDAALAAQEAASYEPPPLSSPTPEQTGPIVAFVGDADSFAAASGVSASGRWPARLRSALGVRTITTASAGAGYRSAGSDGSTFVQDAAQVPSSARTVVFLGGVADATVSPLSVARGATLAFAAAAKQAPRARIIAVGPLFVPSGTAAAKVTALRSAIRSGTRIAGVTWSDPIGSHWLSGVSSTSGLTSTAQRTVADRLEAVIRAAAG